MIDYWISDTDDTEQADCVNWTNQSAVEPFDDEDDDYNIDDDNMDYTLHIGKM